MVMIESITESAAESFLVWVCRGVCFQEMAVTEAATKSVFSKVLGLYYKWLIWQVKILDMN